MGSQRFCQYKYAYFLQVEIATDAFRAESKMHPIYLQDVATRWNSTYTMLQRLAIIKKSINQFCSENVAIRSTLTANDWDLIGSLLPLLKMFYDITLEVRFGGNEALVKNSFYLTT